MALTTNTGSGTQTSTQSPQAGVQSDSSTVQSSGIQPGSAPTLLNSTNGLTLHNTPLTTVSLNTPASSQTQVVAAPQPQHHVNTAYLGLPVALFVVAVVTFWIMSRSVKNTTKYS